MKLTEKAKGELDKKFKKIAETPAGYDFFVAIHDFIEHIESNANLARQLTGSAKMNKELKIPAKYSHLKQIHQGLKDIDVTTNADLGHARYMIRIELSQIRNNDLSESNSFWKKRDFFRRLAGEVYERLNPPSAV